MKIAKKALTKGEISHEGCHTDVDAFQGWQNHLGSTTIRGEWEGGKTGSGAVKGVP
jgi:hypothetical protein